MDFLSIEEIELLNNTISALAHSVLGVKYIHALRDETNPNARTFIVDAEPENVDITAEIISRENNETSILITQNNDQFSSERTITFPTDKLSDIETIRTYRDLVKTQYKSDVMRTILSNSLFGYTDSSVEEQKVYKDRTSQVYTFSGFGEEPVRFIMSETLLDLPYRGGQLDYQEFNTFKKEWETKASYISEALMSTKNHTSGNKTIIGVPEFYGSKWSIDDFVHNQISQRTMEQSVIMSPLHQISNLNALSSSQYYLNKINKDYNIAYKVPDVSENRICDVDVYIYPADQNITEPNEHTKHYIMRYQPPTKTEPGYIKAYDPTGLEPKLIARQQDTDDYIDDMIELTNHLKELSGPMIQKQVEQKKQLSRFSLNHDVAHEENEDLEP
jgi:hypothetical protein